MHKNSMLTYLFCILFVVAVSMVAGYRGKGRGRGKGRPWETDDHPGRGLGRKRLRNSRGSTEMGTSDDHSEQLPVSLQKSCNLVNNFGQPILDCEVHAGESVDLKDIGEWTAQHPGPQQTKISCTGSGVVRASWPFKAINLQRLEIIGCVIKGFLDEIYNHTLDQIPDYLTDMRIRDSAIETNISKLIDFIMHGVTNVPRSVYCGSQKNVNFEFRNNTYTFPVFSSPIKFDYDVTEMKIKEATTGGEYRCEYDDMLTLDMSQSESRSKYSFDIIVNSAHYPKLLNYNLSDNGLSVIPDKFIQLSTVFPALRYLDMSNNNIETVSFTPFHSTDGRVTPVVIDLRRNQVKSIPADTEALVRQTPAILIDLRDNPIVCDCGVKTLRSYLSSITRLFPRFRQLSDVRCSAPSELAGEKVTSSRVSKSLSSCLIT